MNQHFIKTGILLFLWASSTVVASKKPTKSSQAFVPTSIGLTSLENYYHEFKPQAFRVPVISNPNKRPLLQLWRENSTIDGFNNGVGVHSTGNGFRIAEGGYLYERLAPGFSFPVDLHYQKLRIKYSDCIGQNIKVELLMDQKCIAGIKLCYVKFRETPRAGSLRLRVIDHQVAFPIAMSNEIKDVSFNLDDIPGVFPAEVFGLRIYGPLTVHHIDMLDTKHSLYPKAKKEQVVDKCLNYWDTTLQDGTVLFPMRHSDTNEPRVISKGDYMILHTGGGGATWNLNGLALKVTYASNQNGYRLVQIVQEKWKGRNMQTHSFSDYILFSNVSPKRVEFIPIKKLLDLEHLFDPIDISAIIIHGPLVVHEIAVVQESSLRL